MALQVVIVALIVGGKDRGGWKHNQIAGRRVGSCENPAASI